MIRIVNVILIYFRRLASSIRHIIILSLLRFKYSVNIGRGCRIHSGFVCSKRVRIGDYTRIGEGVVLGNDVIIGGHAYLSKITVDDNSHIEGGVKITGNGNGKIVVGKESYIGINNILDWSDNINIGNYVQIAGPSTGLWTHSSAKQAIAGLALADKNPKYRTTHPIVIEDNVYIGGNCTIYPGVKIKHHSIIAPNSAVTKDVASYSLVGGVPAVFIKKIGVD